MRPLVCLHGFTGGPASWDAVLAELPGVDALRPTIAGHGPTAPLAGSFEDEVDRLARALPAAPCHLAGYSLGGRLALGLLVHHRHRFASATLIGVHPGLATEEERRRRRAADEELAGMLERSGLEPFVARWEALPLFATQRALPREVLEAQQRTRLGHRARGLAHALRVLGLGNMPDDSGELPRLDLPVHCMAGELDPKFRRLAERTAAALPRGTVEIVPGAGHNLPLEAPGAVAAAISRSLRP